MNSTTATQPAAVRHLVDFAETARRYRRAGYDASSCGESLRVGYFAGHDWRGWSQAGACLTQEPHVRLEAGIVREDDYLLTAHGISSVPMVPVSVMPTDALSTLRGEVASCFGARDSQPASPVFGI
ncbi:hypothetical protein HN937_16990 [Candidatus Poribacteria bacterium]|jgi:hypothetical protein|nr:hypothetical protein [Candidatus Poribacteria bacterium]